MDITNLLSCQGELLSTVLVPEAVYQGSVPPGHPGTLARTKSSRADVLVHGPFLLTAPFLDAEQPMCLTGSGRVGEGKSTVLASLGTGVQEK